MKETSITKKVGEKYENMITLKQGQYGWQLSFSPAFQQELSQWLKGQNGQWLNMNVKVWDSQPQQTQQVEQVQELNDEIPPF